MNNCESEDKIRIAVKQLEEILKYRKLTITCADCGKNMQLSYMYRCYECDLYICIKCADKHFDMNKKLILKNRRVINDRTKIHYKKNT